MDRFDPQARLVLWHAKLEAQRLGHARIAPEHLLLGALNLEHKTVEALRQMGLGLAQARKQLEERVGSRDPLPANHVPEIGSTATTCMQAAAAEARRLGSEQVGVEHVVLGIIRTAEQSTKQPNGSLTVAQMLNELEGGVRGVMRQVLGALQMHSATSSYMGLQLEPKKVVQLSLSLEFKEHQKLLELAQKTKTTPEQLIHTWVREHIQNDCSQRPKAT